MTVKQTKEERKRQLHSKKSGIFLLLGILVAVGFWNLLVPDKLLADEEAKKQAEKPKFSWGSFLDGTYTKEYETYRQEYFAGKSFSRSIKTTIDFLGGNREENGVIRGKSHYLLEEIASMDEGLTTKTVASMKTFQETYYHIPMYSMLVPNAADILSDKMPSYKKGQTQAEQFQQIRTLLGSDITWVDVRSALKSHTDKEIYYHTDKHWTTLGARYGYQALAGSMGLDTGKEPELKEYAVTGNFNGTLSAVSGYESGYGEPLYIYDAKKKDERIQTVAAYAGEKETPGAGTETTETSATLYDVDSLNKRDKYEVFFGGDYPLIEIRTNADSTERLLVFKNSYANCLIPFLTPYFREIIMVDPEYYTGDIHQVMEEKKITGVLFLFDGNTFVRDEKLSGVLDNGKTE